MQNKSFAACKATPLNIRSRFHKDVIAPQDRIKGEVYRLCDNDKSKSCIDPLEKQLGKGVYFFIPMEDDVGPNLTGALVIRNPTGNYIVAYTHAFYTAHNESTYKLRSVRDVKDKEVILACLKEDKIPVQPSPFNWK